MSKKYSLHIGIQQYSGYYPKSINRLHYCLNDADAMLRAAEKLGFTAKPLHNTQATLDSVQKTIAEIAQEMNGSGGGIFMLTFAGHGTQSLDSSLDERIETIGVDKFDECLCLHDKLMFDNEVKSALSEFNKDTKIICFFDSCHSGTAVSMFPENYRGLTHEELKSFKATYFFKKAESSLKRLLGFGPKINAPWISFAACDDQSKAFENNENGCFTRAVKQVFQVWSPQMSYNDFFNAIVHAMESDPFNTHEQTPFLYCSDGFILNEKLF